MSENVYIIGAGIHPFGRTEGRSGREQGVFAVREALADAGLEWPDIECAYGGSAAAGSADIMVNELGLTSLPFTNVANGCATGGSALASAQMAVASGMYDLALAVGFDKHPRGAFNAKPKDYGLPEWYGQAGMMLTTQFFALKIQRYMQ
ncbi:MAG TPA: acetyl-CoA acetyltransferase, partial [Erythrobacter sp.]|nr:acetyl-CoA acetyltransferase [Erythrobacter sp.]